MNSPQFVIQNARKPSDSYIVLINVDRHIKKSSPLQTKRGMNQPLAEKGEPARPVRAGLKTRVFGLNPYCRSWDQCSRFQTLRLPTEKVGIHLPSSQGRSRLDK